eukprot:5791914-Alexandrium_andersonii.AAC.1
MAWIRDHGWGPAQAREEQRRTWNELRRAGIAEAPDWFTELASRDAERDRRLLLRPEASQIQPQLTRAQARALGPTLYRAAWRRRHELPFRRWMMRRSTSRRWWPTEGNEWQLLAASSNLTAAFH